MLMKNLRYFFRGRLGVVETEEESEEVEVVGGPEQVKKERMKGVTTVGK